MLYVLPLFVFSSLLSMQMSYAAQLIMINPYFNSKILNAQALKEQSKKKLQDVIAQAPSRPHAVYVYSFDVQYESRATPEIYPDEAFGTGKLVSRSPLNADHIVASCLPLSDLPKDSFFHLLSHQDYFTSPVSSQRRYLADKAKECDTYSVEADFIPSNLKETDTLIYVIGDDSPTDRPDGLTSLTVEAWHEVRINSLRNRCKSVVVLISKNRYSKIATQINRFYSSAIIEDETVSAETRSYRPLFISLGMVGVCVIAGLFYTYFYNKSLNGSCSNS